jgi:hypothetical protein
MLVVPVVDEDLEQHARPFLPIPGGSRGAGADLEMKFGVWFSHHNLLGTQYLIRPTRLGSRPEQHPGKDAEKG